MASSRGALVTVGQASHPARLLISLHLQGRTDIRISLEDDKVHSMIFIAKLKGPISWKQLFLFLHVY